MNKRYQVFISSTYSDLKEERSKVMQTIMSLDCIPAGMELFPAIDDEQFDFIKKIIDDCDYYVLIVGGRYGSISQDGISYTEKEFDYAISKEIPVIAFLHEDIGRIIVDKSDIEHEKREKLILFRNKVSTGRLVQTWSNPDDLNGKVAISLTKTIKTYPAIGWVRANLQTNAESLQEMNVLRKKLAELTEYKNSIENAKKAQASDVIKLIAGLDESIDVNGTYTYYHNTNRCKGKWNISLSWRELFAAISPFFMEPQTDSYAKTIIDDVLYKLSKTSNSRARSHKINNQNFQTIKIQLKALGLFKIDYMSTTAGHKSLFWILTESGNQLMMETRIIKTQG